MTEQRLDDVATLAQSSLLSLLEPADVAFLLGHLEVVSAEADEPIATRAASPGMLHFVLEGRARIARIERAERAERADGSAGEIAPGDVFGEASLAGPDVARETVVALTPMRLARLSPARFEALSAAHPAVALHLLRAVFARLAARWGAEAPRAASAAGPPSAASVAAPRERVRVGDRLPREASGAPVVAGRWGERLLPLQALVDADADVAAVSTATWEGRDVYRASAALALLEAARRASVTVRLGPSITSGRLVLLPPSANAVELARDLERHLDALIRENAPIEEEVVSVQDALARFASPADRGAALLLADSIEPVVTLLRCGETSALRPGPLLPSAGHLEDLRLFPHPLGLLLDFGHRIRSALPRRPASTLVLESRAPRYGAAMTMGEAAWLAAMGIDSVGAFNEACVGGKTPELVRVSEGFHEKHVAELADRIEARPEARFVAVAGPSSSGKTTFIKRLVVQLRVVGLRALEFSVDDYYVDRARTVRDELGNYDFEALEALDLDRLEAHLEALLRGESIRPPRYDFVAGRSLPDAGAEMKLGPRDVLLVEGIHALNPRLYGAIDPAAIFRVFVHPGMSLPFDRLSALDPSEVRLLRRLVRDRHQRGFAAAETLARWPSVRRGERLHIYPFQPEADVVFDTSLAYEVNVLRVYAERYLLEVPRDSPEAPAAHRLRRLLQHFVPIHPDGVPPTSILREFIGGSGFVY